MKPLFTRTRLAAVALALALATLAVATPTAAIAAERPIAPPINRAYNNWTAVLADADCDGAPVAALYTPQAILLATFKDYIAGRAAITSYFDDLSCRENLSVSTQRITSARIGSMGYATGLYTFTYNSIEDTTVTVPARFTFVFELRNGKWLIVNHHSSQDPETS